jgi:hypothetical protein
MPHLIRSLSRPGATTKGLRHPKEACVNCHFFSKEQRIVTDDEREKAKNKDFSWLGDYETLKCSRTVWDDGYWTEDSPGRDPEGRFGEIVARDRKGWCFFWPYHRGMLVTAAEILEKRESEAREAATDRKHVLWGLRFAVAGLLISAVVGGFQAYYARDSARAAWAAVVAKEKPLGSAQKAPPVPVNPAAPSPAARPK